MVWPGIMLTSEIRELLIRQSREVNRAVETLPDSPDKKRYLKWTAAGEEFWKNADRDFIRQWADVAMRIRQ